MSNSVLEVCITTELTELQLDLAVSDYTSQEYWNAELARLGSPLLGGFIFKRPRKLPPFEGWNPPNDTPGKPDTPAELEQLRRERRGESIGPVTGEARPFGARRVRLKTDGFKLSEKRALLALGYEPYIILDCARPATVEGPDGAYLIQSDRGRKLCASGSDDPTHAASSRSVFPYIPVPHAPYRSTGEEAFERRLKDHEAKLALEEMRIPSAAMQWAVTECAVKGRRPSDVIEGKPELNLNTLKSHSQRVRRRAGKLQPPVRHTYIPREPIAIKTVETTISTPLPVTDYSVGWWKQPHTQVQQVVYPCKVYPPVKRQTRFARKGR